MRRKLLPVLLICVACVAGYACKSKKQTESFPVWREAFSNNPSVDSQLNDLRRLFPEAEVKLVPKGIRLTLASGILFAVNSSDLSPAALQQLDKLGEVIRQYPASSVLVEGHTDITGSTDYNKTLSERRAVSVRDYLISQDIDPDRITATGYGEARPVATNSTERGQKKNRRVELYIIP